jgi:hypothetical protein
MNNKQNRMELYFNVFAQTVFPITDSHKYLFFDG